MAVKITDATWLAYQVERVKGVLTVNLVKDQTYTNAELIALVKSFGLSYTSAVMIQIRDALIADGTIETV